MASRIPIALVAATLLCLPGCGGGEDAPEPTQGKPIALKISGGFPAFRWELRVDSAGRATVTRGGPNEPKRSEPVSIPADDLAEIYEQLDAADFQVAE